MLLNKKFDKFIQTVRCAPPLSGSGKNWLLVMPRMTIWDDQQYIFPVGIPYVSSALKITGRNVTTLNLTYKEREIRKIFEEAIQHNNIDIIATGGLTDQYSTVKEIIDVAKSIKPDIIAVVGGGLITSEPVASMTALENVDFGVIGEGEITICDLAYALETNTDFSDVQGIIYKKENEWKLTQARGEIDDLDMLPWPDYDGFEYAEMLTKVPHDLLTVQNATDKLGTLYFSRSCPYNCTFCFHSSGKKFRTRTIDGFFEEFDYLMKKYLFNTIYISDEFLLTSLKFVKNFCKKIKPYNIRWTCLGRVDNITKEMLEILIDAGCYKIGFGVESASDEILKSMRKNITRAQIENAFTLCDEIGIEAQGGLIFGDLEETIDTAMDTINWWKNHQRWRLNLFWIVAYPGSYVYKVSCERGIISDPVQYIKDGCPEINFSKMTDDERRIVASVIAMQKNEQNDILENTSLLRGKFGKVTLKGICPYCNVIAEFPNLDPIRPQKMEICPHCNHTLRLHVYGYVDKKVFDDNIRKMLESHKIAFWPLVHGLSEFFETSNALKSDNVFIIDSSPYKQGIEIYGKVVQSPDIIHQKKIDTIFFTTATSIVIELADIIKKDFPNVKHTGLIGDLYFASEERIE